LNGLRRYPVLGALLVIAVLNGLACLIGLTFVRAQTYLTQSRLESQSYAAAPKDMVFVPPGHFLMGSDAPEADHTERPLRYTFLPGFYIDTYEVTNAQYQAFDPNHAFPPERAHFPVTGVGLEEARDYCECMGKRLPTSAEWEKAARGTDGRTFPWGEGFTSERANLASDGDLTDVGSFPQGVSPYGAHDMTGNAWEWVDDTYRDADHLGADVGFDRGIVRGGGYSYPPYQGRASYLSFEAIEGTCNDLGFRCAKDAMPADSDS
jgi:formylglycine-generating enzyme required for sulfatase activity